MVTVVLDLMAALVITARTITVIRVMDGVVVFIPIIIGKCSGFACRLGGCGSDELDLE